jgi:hypothetical protein
MALLTAAVVPVKSATMVNAGCGRISQAMGHKLNRHASLIEPLSPIHRGSVRRFGFTIRWGVSHTQYFVLIKATTGMP